MATADIWKVSQAVALALAVVLVGFFAVGFPALLFSAALLGGLVLWTATGLTVPVDVGRVMGPYLVTTLLFTVHVGEEYLGRIDILLSTISGHLVTQREFLLLAAFFAPAFWLAGAILIVRRLAIGGYIMSVFYFGMVVGEATHFAFPFLEDGKWHYTAGAVTAVPLMVSAALGLRVAWTESRRCVQLRLQFDGRRPSP